MKVKLLKKKKATVILGNKTRLKKPRNQKWAGRLNDRGVLFFVVLWLQSMFSLPFSVRSKKFCSCKQLARAKCCSCRQNLHVQHCSCKWFRTNNENSLHVQVLFCSSKFLCMFSRYETLHMQNTGSFCASGVSKFQAGVQKQISIQQIIYMNISTFSEVFLNKDNSSWDSATFSMLEDGNDTFTNILKMKIQNHGTILSENFLRSEGSKTFQHASFFIPSSMFITPVYISIKIDSFILL